MGLVAEFLIKSSNRLGIDLDECSELEMLKAYFNTKYMFPDKTVKVFQSSGGDGYHIRVHGVKSRLSIRRTLGDCRMRMEYSEMRSKNKDNKELFVFSDPLVDDVMFSFKTKHVMKDGKIVKTQRQKVVEIDEHYIIAQRFW